MQSTLIRRMVLAGLLAAAFGLIAYKVAVLGFDLEAIVPDKGYDVTFSMTFEGTGDPVKVETYLPREDDRQEILREKNASGRLSFATLHDHRGVRGLWRSEEVSGPQEVVYSFHAKAEHVVFELSEDLIIPTTYPERAAPYLQATSDVQVDDPYIGRIFEEHVPKARRLLPVVRAIYGYASGLTPMPFKGRTDAVTAARLGEASCNGKSRLFLALARRAGIPGRLVGGLIMTDGTKQVSHQWTELFVNGYWVPFDALNDHFASLPDHYLALYYGDAYLFSHTPNINFAYSFGIQKQLASQDLLASALSATGPMLNPYRAWANFAELGLPLDLLKILLLIPVGALLVVFFRNVIGLETYGVFLPALVATACLQAGLLPTLGGFVIITALVALLSVPLERWGLLYTPKMALMLLAVVAAMLALTYVSVRSGWFDFSYLSLLPLVIVAVTAERFSQHIDEEGVAKAAKVMGMTLIVITGCYAVMALPVVQLLFLAFPELLLVVGAANLWMGRWMGMRLTEYWRFRWLIDRRSAPERLAALHGEVLGINRRNGAVIHPANDRRHFALADDKCLTKAVLEEQGVPVPPTLAVFSEIGQIREYWSVVEEHEEFVVKPAKGRAGNSILVLERTEEGWVTPGGRLLEADALKRHLTDIIFGLQSYGAWDAALIEYRVRAHPFFTRLYDRGLPDLRVITHHGRLVQAMLRMPTSASDGKANLHQGALGVAVDLKTGRLGKGYDYEGHVSVHNDSQVSLKGLQLPHWPRILDMCRLVSEIMPLGYLGIDIVIDRDRGPLVIEVNARPGLEIQNVNEQGLRPLLEEAAHAA